MIRSWLSFAKPWTQSIAWLNFANESESPWKKQTADEFNCYFFTVQNVKWSTACTKGLLLKKPSDNVCKCSAIKVFHSPIELGTCRRRCSSQLTIYFGGNMCRFSQLLWFISALYLRPEKQNYWAEIWIWKKRFYVAYSKRHFRLENMECVFFIKVLSANKTKFRGEIIKGRMLNSASLISNPNRCLNIPPLAIPLLRNFFRAVTPTTCRTDLSWF